MHCTASMPSTSPASERRLDRSTGGCCVTRGGGITGATGQVSAAEHADDALQDLGQGALGVGSPVAPGGRTRQNTRMLPLRSCTSLYSRRFSSSVPLYLAATLLSSSTCARASGFGKKS